MRYHLLAIDLDGTLLNRDKEIDIENIQAIHEFRKKGGRVIISSGRSPLSTRWIADTIGLKGEPIIAYNGAVSLDENGQVERQEAFQHEHLLHFWELCQSEGIYAHFYEGDTLLVPAINKWNEHWIENNIPALEKSGGTLKGSEHFRDRCGVKVIKDFYQYFKKNEPSIVKIAVFDDGRGLADFSKRLSKQVNGLEISSSLNYLNLEISSNGISKASSLLKLIERLGVPVSKTAAIGDNFNDILMLSIAGLGIAMGNAPTEVKAAADAVTGNNEQAGVAEAIYRYLIEK